MDGDSLKILILAGRLDRHEDGCGKPPWLDRLERRGCRAQVLCLAREAGHMRDPRVFEVPALRSWWRRGLAARSVWGDLPLDRPDLMHVVHDEMIDAAVSVCEWGLLPYVQTVADFRTLERGLRLSRRFCRHVVARSADVAEELTGELGLPVENVTVIKPGIMLAEESPPSPGTDRVPVIGTGSLVEEESGLGVFLDAARRILDSGHDTEFVVTGRGVAHADLRRKAHELGLGERVTMADVRYAGAQYWRALNIYCQPCVAPSSGTTLLRAMAHGVPSIATRVRGLRSLVEHDSSGLVVAPDDPEALARAIIELLENPEYARALGRSARKRVQTAFDPDFEADRLIELYREILGSPRTERPLQLRAHLPIRGPRANVSVERGHPVRNPV
jgi:glycosyltransferase involved in cell wall biosynthesis